jgi:hypothetical protein
MPHFEQSIKGQKHILSSVEHMSFRLADANSETPTIVRIHGCTMKTEAARLESDLLGLARKQDASTQAVALQSLRDCGYSRLRSLKCEVTDGVVGLWGQVPSFFLKQLAQTVVLKLERVRAVENWVEVQKGGANPSRLEEE